MTTFYSIPGFYLMLEGSATSTSNLEWTLSTFFKADKELLALKNSGKTIYDALNEELAATEPAAPPQRFRFPSNLAEALVS